MKFRKLKAEEIDCRVAQIASNYCTLLLYKDARVDMNILDETVGCMNWQKHYSRDNANCIISIWDDEKKQWIEKEDTGVESFTEQEKGLASDSAKRSGFCWGIGRELYTAPNIMFYPRKDITYKNDNKTVPEFFEYKEGKYTTKTRFYVDYIDYDENNITDLIIRDHKGNIRFEQLRPVTQKQFNKEFTDLKKLIELNEEKDDSFDREEFYKYFGVASDNQLNFNQRKEAAELLNKRLEKVDK